MDRSIAINSFPELSLFNTHEAFSTNLTCVESDDGVYLFALQLKAATPSNPTPCTIRWRLPYVNMKGTWRSGGVHDKRQRYDWELDHLQSRVSVDAPVISVFGHDDTNAITFACTDAINMVEMNAVLREEDNHLYCHLTFFAERHPAITEYETQIRIDIRRIGFSKALQDTAAWWATQTSLQPAQIPPLALAPLYSTWYQFHQDLEEAILIEECTIAKEMGYDLIILDDGWQTLDSNRGYDYTGDWQPDRIPDMAGFVAKLHTIGMQVGLWFSVPFCGVKSKAYQRFKGKFLTENHRWAPVFDPRYPDVRAYLIDTYVQALRDYKLDAFKLDFIDDFKVYPETELTLDNGRDYANVNAAVDRLLTDVMEALRVIKPDVVIEFRQQYVGPAMRKFGHMFRAFDCPNDGVSNRIRITDVKLLSGETAVHSDPQTWHPDEPVELAALQVLNGFFGVPQMSVHLRNLPTDHRAMVQYYTQLWRELSPVLMGGQFTAVDPSANYPYLMTATAEHTVIGLYQERILTLPETVIIDILNGSPVDEVILKHTGVTLLAKVTITDCCGQVIMDENTTLPQGISTWQVPRAGHLRFQIL